ncbi:MAG: hypothetical protein IJB52_12310, partial [Clostridia bacterium]|nr:hypothetical protein [Clostridia bacterium]
MAIERRRWLWVLLTAVMVFYDHRRGKRVFVLAYSGLIFTKTLVGGVLPDGTQRIGRGEVGAQTPLLLPSL